MAINYALTSNGGTATATSMYAPANAVPSYAIDGNRVATWTGGTNIWHSDSPFVKNFDSSNGLTAVQVFNGDLGQNRLCDKINVVGVRNTAVNSPVNGGYNNFNDPNPIGAGETNNVAGAAANNYALYDFTVEVATAEAPNTWVNVATITDNTLVLKPITFAARTFRYYRITFTRTGDGYVRVQEIEVLSSASSFAISTASPLPNAGVGAPYSAQIESANAIPPVNSTQAATVSAGALPPGLAFTSSDGSEPTRIGSITGTTTTAGTYNFTIRGTDDAGAVATKAFALTVNPAPGSVAPLSITNTSPLPGAQTGTFYSYQLQKTGGTGSGAWSQTIGNLPAGALAPNGVITISTVGSSNYTFTARFTDANGAYVEKSFTIPVSALASITLCHKRPLSIEYIEKIRYFEPLSGADEVIEDAPLKRQFRMMVLYVGTADQSELRQFLYNHRKREPFLWFNPDRNETMTVKMVSPYSEEEMLAYGQIEITLREV